MGIMGKLTKNLKKTLSKSMKGQEGFGPVTLKGPPVKQSSEKSPEIVLNEMKKATSDALTKAGNALSKIQKDVQQLKTETDPTKRKKLGEEIQNLKNEYQDAMKKYRNAYKPFKLEGVSKESLAKAVADINHQYNNIVSKASKLKEQGIQV